MDRSLWGKRLRVAMYICAICGTVVEFYSRIPTTHIDFSHADDLARENGWSKAKDGWKCQRCKVQAKIKA